MRFRIKYTLMHIVALLIFFSCVPLYAQSVTDLDLQSFQKQKEQYEAKSRTDPFASGVSAADQLAVEDLQLTGIAYKDDKNSYALISGYLVRPGDRIAGYRVEAIEKDKVRLRRLDEVLVLALGGGI